VESILIDSESEILIGRDLPDPLLPPNPDRRRVVVITQPGARVVAERAMQAAASTGVEVSLLLMPDREAAKSLTAVERAYHHLADFGLGRHDTVMAVGGGAVTDSGGFIAATWMRGVELVHVPTTLLAAIDAAIGGKTAVNLAGKNLVGVFWHPRRIVIDLDVIASLPDELKSEGAAEAIKAGLLAAPEIVEAYLERGLAADLELVVPAAVRVKADVVSRDFREAGERALLNLGHTVGHGLEFAAGISHGRAVAIGLVAAAAVSERLCDFGETTTVIGALEAAGLPTRAPRVDRRSVLTLVARDKKRTAEGIRMVLLEGIGRPVLRQVTDEDLAAGLVAVGL
jgi:3-dehydroquinate synthase